MMNAIRSSPAIGRIPYAVPVISGPTFEVICPVTSLTAPVYRIEGVEGLAPSIGWKVLTPVNDQDEPIAASFYFHPSVDDQTAMNCLFPRGYRRFEFAVIKSIAT